jgi:NADP-dependent aldehyde dehydrogenase
MLYRGIRDAYESGVDDFAKIAGVKLLARAARRGDESFAGRPALLSADVRTYLANPVLSQEVFGPSTLLLSGSREQLLEMAAKLEGHLTATIHGTADDLREYGDLVAILQRKVGRLVFNGFPTGIEPCPSVHHGGPYPACSDGGRTTSIGTAAIERFTRPLCYQNWPDAALPPELQNGNPRGIWRLVDGQVTKDAVG